MSTASAPHGGCVLADSVRQLYRQGQTDYSLEPLILVDHKGSPLGRIRDGDAVVFCCRRGEREIQLTEAFTDSHFPHFPRQPFQQLPFVILTLYHEKFKDLPVAFAPTQVKATLAEVISQAGLSQLHISESEKFAHVTFFFNGGSNLRFPLEDDLGIPSPKGILYEQIPELSLPTVSQELITRLGQGYAFIVANFANGDVIGHTANTKAKIQCAQYVDAYLGQVIQAAIENGYIVMVTADHGNLEELLTPEGTPHVSHTANPVPFILIDPRPGSLPILHPGSLAGIAPTVLQALGLPIPPEMDPSSLAPGYNWGGPRKALLLILDGWGLGCQDDSNPIYLAKTPIWDNLYKRYPTTHLQAAGQAVGLKPGKAGNSEAGHINIGSGRVVLQDDVRLDLAMQDGSFYSNEVLCETIRGVKQRHASLHLIGLLTEKSSHGSMDYPLAVMRMAKDQGLEKVYLHMIFDGRSTQPGSAPALLEKLDCLVSQIGIGQVVTGVGREFALDRDGDYSKTQRAYAALVDGSGIPCTIITP